MIETIFTIGGYGFSPEGFINTLKSNEVDLFCDIRQRRGLRGKKYSFLNSLRLQETLAEAGIQYIYFKNFAPHPGIRELQKLEDQKSGVLKRSRSRLGDAFATAYSKDILGTQNAADFLEEIPSQTKGPCLFCVEQLPTACHRSLMAEWLSDFWKVPVRHLEP